MLVVLLFCGEAIKKEKTNKVKCDADEIDIYIQQDEPLFVPSTSLLVAVVLVTCLLFGFSSFLFECLLRRTASGARKTKKLPLNVVSPSPPLKQHVKATVSILVTNALLKHRGQPIIQVGLLWIPHSIEAGLFLSNVCSMAMFLFLRGSS